VSKTLRSLPAKNSLVSPAKAEPARPIPGAQDLNKSLAKLEKKLKTFNDGFDGLGDGKDVKMLRIFHQPGWTTIAELATKWEKSGKRRRVALLQLEERTRSI